MYLLFVHHVYWNSNKESGQEVTKERYFLHERLEDVTFLEHRNCQMAFYN